MKNLFLKLKDQAGLSLLETTLGILILSVGVMGMLPMMTTATANTVGGEQRVAATYLANEKLEEIIADKEFQGYDFIAEQNYAAENLSSNSFTRSVTVTEVDANDLSTPDNGSGYKKIEVIVGWTVNNGNSQQVTVTTLVTE